MLSTVEPTETRRSIAHRLGYAVLVLFMIGIAGILFLHNTGSTPTQILPQPNKGTQWKLILNDSFDGSKLNSSIWTTCYDWYNQQDNGCSNTGNFEQEWYMPQQVSVQDGHALLEAISKPTIGFF